jgi:hypothetical protein
MSIDEFFKYLQQNPDADEDAIEQALGRIDDPGEREMASFSAGEFLASLNVLVADDVE